MWSLVLWTLGLWLVSSAALVTLGLRQVDRTDVVRDVGLALLQPAGHGAPDPDRHVSRAPGRHRPRHGSVYVCDLLTT